MESFFCRALRCVLVVLFVAGCGPFKGVESSQTQSVPQQEASLVEEASAVKSEFSYHEVPGQEEIVEHKNIVAVPKSDRSQQTKVNAKATISKSVPSDGPEVCTRLSTQRCVSCCEDFYLAGSERWDECSLNCLSQSIETMKEY